MTTLYHARRAHTYREANSDTWNLGSEHTAQLVSAAMLLTLSFDDHTVRYIDSVVKYKYINK
jgi:hypothetical protein